MVLLGMWSWMFFCIMVRMFLLSVMCLVGLGVMGLVFELEFGVVGNGILECFFLCFFV